MTKVTTGEVWINGQFVWKGSMSNSRRAISHVNGAGRRPSNVMDH
jgi:hypothetical protein